VTRNNLLLFLSVMAVISFTWKFLSYYIPWTIVGINVVSVYLWTALFTVIAIAIHPKILASKSFLWLYLIIISRLLLQAIRNSRFDFPGLILGVSDIGIALTLYVLYTQYMDIRYQRLFLRVLLFIIAVSMILSIVGLIRYPEAVRNITSGAEGEEGIEFYNALGISGYGFFTGLPPLVPVLVFLSRKSKKRSARYFYGTFLGVLLLSIFLCGITTPLILALVGLALAILGYNRLRRNNTLLFIILLVLLWIAIPPDLLVNRVIGGLADLVPNSEVAERLEAINRAAEGEFEVTASSQTMNAVEARFQRVFWNLDAFIKNPLVGYAGEMPRGSFHLYWLHRLARTGILGTLPLIGLLVFQFLFNSKKFTSEYKFYYGVGIGLFFAMGMLKAIGGWFTYFVPYFLVPSLYYLHDTEERACLKTEISREAA